tara:strand:+ start:77 stop:676 length:600 start_codon:yes stop_codon:yes gene_type:complete
MNFDPETKSVINRTLHLVFEHETPLADPEYKNIYRELHDKLEPDTITSLDDLEEPSFLSLMFEKGLPFLESRLEEFQNNNAEIKELKNELSNIEDGNSSASPGVNIFISFAVYVSSFAIYLIVEPLSGILFWLLDKLLFIIFTLSGLIFLYTIYSYFVNYGKTNIDVLKEKIENIEKNNLKIRKKILRKYPLFKKLIEL